MAASAAHVQRCSEVPVRTSVTPGAINAWAGPRTPLRSYEICCVTRKVIGGAAV
jgi:hypothetical protein